MAKEEDLKIAAEEKAKWTGSTKVKSKKPAMVYYKRDSPEYKEITRCLAGFVGGTNTPNSIVQDAKFKSFLEAMNPAYPVPSRTTCQMRSHSCFWR